MFTINPKENERHLRPLLGQKAAEGVAAQCVTWAQNTIAENKNKNLFRNAKLGAKYVVN